MKKLVLFLIVLGLVCGCGNSSSEKVKEVIPITTDSVFSMIDEDDVYIIDVREEFEYNSGHIRNAYNIPLNEISGIGKKFIPLDSTVIVYCRSGSRSREAALILLDLGYLNVYDMGGVNSWNYELITE